jgi:hypothetical protein
MKEILTPVQWAELIGKVVKHKLFKECSLQGLRISCEENNNLMLLVYTKQGQFFWVYDYETEPQTL